MFFKKLGHLSVLQAPSQEDPYCGYILDVDGGKLENFATQHMIHARQKQQQPINFRYKIDYPNIESNMNEFLNSLP
jgi:hypothetical protein